MTDIVSLLGPTLDGQNGATVDTQTLVGDDKYVGLYFSAHWCPPCRGFTPILSEFYKKFRETRETLEIVFVSSDREVDSFNGYFKEMPWLALPYSERAKKGELGQKFGVTGIPTFVILHSKTGVVITKGGRDKVMEDPNGASFPWEN